MKTRKDGKCNKLTKLVCMLLSICTIICFLQTPVKAVAAETEVITLKGYAKVASVLNVRQQPSTQSMVIEKLEPGEIVTIIQKNDMNEWTQVQTKEGIVGFVKSEYLQIAFSDSNKYELLAVAVITKTDGSSENRNYNMARAASFINGIILQPEEEFAWYTTQNTEGVVGPASKENGYKEAPIIVSGKPKMGYGGGVCQVSTALYNCINKLEIQPIVHYHHSLTSTYVEEGMDATVSYPNKNFVFKNTKDYPILFEVYTDGPQVVAAAYRIVEN